MALTRVSRHIIDEPFNPTTVSATDVTATNINASGIGTVGTLNVTGNLTVQGTTTTLDTILTEVDRLEVSANNTVAAGIITQTGSGDILNLFDGSSSVFRVLDGGNVKIGPAGNPGFGAGSGLEVERAGAATIRIEDTSSSSSFEIQNTSGVIKQRLYNNQPWTIEYGSGEKLRIKSDGKVGIGTDNPQSLLSLYQSGGGFEINANSGSNNARLLSYDRPAGVHREMTFQAASYVFETSGTERLRILNDGRVRVPDGGKFVAGASDDLQIYHDGSWNYIQSHNSKNFVIQVKDNENAFVAIPDGEVQLFHNNSKKFETTSTGVSITGQIDIGTTSIHSTGEISMGDNDKLRLGAGDDLQIYHTGSHSLIDETGTGNLVIRSNLISFEKYTNEQLARFTADGSCEFYYDNVKKFETTSTGVKLPDNQKVELGDGSDLQIWSDNTDQYIRGEQNQLILRSNNLKLQSYLGENYIHCANNNSVSLYYDNSKKFETTTTGVEVSGATKTDTLEVTQEYPSIRPTLDLNFAATKSLDRRITFTRDSVGTFIGEDGLVKYASNNVPRFDHDPTTGESLGLLSEESRTNLVLYSNSGAGLDDAPYYGNWNAAPYTDNFAVAPDGTTTAWKMSPNTPSSSRVQRISVTAGNTYTFSVWLKKDPLVSVSDGVWDYLGYLITWSQNGSTVTGATTQVLVAGSSASQELTTEWRRFSVSYTAPANMTSMEFGLSNRNAGSGNPGYSVFVWGAQIEEGAFATSLIPTLDGSSVTRAADLPYIEGSNFSDFYDTTGSGGTFFVEFGGSNTSGTILSLGPDSGYTQTTGFGNSGYTQGLVSSNYNTYNTYGGTGAADAGWNTTGTNKFAFTITSSQVKLCGNGKSVKTGSGTTPIFTNFTKLTFGGNIVWDKTYTGQKKNHIRSIKYYRSLLPDAQLQGLTQQ